ncbi:MAG: glycosyltransferase family 2 protein [Anaerolineales bacterium]|nr:glycosyltransferase family 2 protein [Anaerolineales bacterium]
MKVASSEIEITILISTRNRINEITECLTSLRKFGYMDRADIEIIVVDNNSSDDTTSYICRSFSIIYLVETKSGKSASLNRGIRSSHGQFIVFIDDDVVICSETWIDELRSNFLFGEKIGYVSGNVKAYKTETIAEKMWEKKGGLSKGNTSKMVGWAFFRKFRLAGVPVRLIGAGANCMISKKTLQDVGNFDELLGPGSLVGGGESLDIVYRILQKGYFAKYDPGAVVLHKHPELVAELKSKMFHYGIADSAIHTKFFLEFGDWRSLFEILISRNLQLLFRLAGSFVGIYPLSPDILIFGIAGNLIGPFKYVHALMKIAKTPYSISRGTNK